MDEIDFEGEFEYRNKEGELIYGFCCDCAEYHKYPGCSRNEPKGDINDG